MVKAVMRKFEPGDTPEKTIQEAVADITVCKCFIVIAVGENATYPGANVRIYSNGIFGENVVPLLLATADHFDVMCGARKAVNQANDILGEKSV